jgi:ABC-type branched-subunit amino acid transport system ATPase component
MVTAVFEKLAEIVATNVSAIIVDQNAVQAMALADQVAVVSRGSIVYFAPVDRARAELNVVHAHLGIT